MSRRKIILSLSVLLLAGLACNFVAPAESTPPPLTVIVEPTFPTQENVLQSEDQVPRVPIEQALVGVQSGAAVVIDVRSVQAYEANHVPGALSIPLPEIEADPNGLPLDKDQWIITYCT